MLCDSHSVKPSSSMVGTRPVGFMRRYSGVLFTPCSMPASTRSYLRPSSSAAQSAFLTFTELTRPQIFNMTTPRGCQPRPPSLRPAIARVMASLVQAASCFVRPRAFPLLARATQAVRVEDAVGPQITDGKRRAFVDHEQRVARAVVRMLGQRERGL